MQREAGQDGLSLVVYRSQGFIVTVCILSCYLGLCGNFLEYFLW